MSTKATEREVNRLLDIVVEEVSLVDRAANKHRFLIVKRSNLMDEATNDTQASAGQEPAAGATESPCPADAPADETHPEAAPGNDPAQGAEAVPATDTAAPSPLEAAVAALEGLTETVEELGSVEEDEARAQVGELATELRAMSERLARAAGATPTEDPPETDVDEQVAAAAAEHTAAFSEVVAAVRATLGRVDALLAAAAKPAETKKAAGDSGSKPPATDEPPGSPEEAKPAARSGDKTPAIADIARHIAAVVEGLKALSESVHKHHQRLSRLEKRSGLPQSTPVGERPPTRDDESLGWPLDLNRPFDRESVDKAVSFHDV